MDTPVAALAHLCMCTTAAAAVIPTGPLDRVALGDDERPYGNNETFWTVRVDAQNRLAIGAIRTRQKQFIG